MAAKDRVNMQERSMAIGFPIYRDVCQFLTRPKPVRDTAAMVGVKIALKKAT
jgi:hypothetical protein